MNATAVESGFSKARRPSADFKQIQAIANAQSRFTDFRGATAEQGNGVTSVGSLSPSVIALPAKILRKPPVLIDSVLSKEEFLLLIEHMGNGNPISYFLTVWRDEVGNARYAKAKPHKRADLQASWTWDTIKGRAKRKTSIEGWRNCVNTGCLKTAVVVRQHG